MTNIITVSWLYLIILFMLFWFGYAIHFLSSMFLLRNEYTAGLSYYPWHFVKYIIDPKRSADKYTANMTMKRIVFGYYKFSKFFAVGGIVVILITTFFEIVNLPLFHSSLGKN